MTFKHPVRRRGFTLVELLVVIGIIALLISILLPSLASARKAANNIKCLANLRSITQAMQIYASQNNGSIPGSAWTTTQYLYSDVKTAAFAAGYSTTSGNYATFQIWDWMTPIAKTMGVKFNDGSTNADRLERFEQLRKYPGFTCPENGFLTDAFASSLIKPPTDISVSYCTALGFLVQRSNGSVSAAEGRTVGQPPWYNPSSSYNVKTSKVGDASRKIYIGDGGSFSRCSQAPTINLSPTPTAGGAFSDVGAWSGFSNSWDRGAAPGNTPKAGHTPVIHDARIFAYRHGSNRRFGSADTYKANFAFFDGHAETLGDLQSSNPALWHPKGTTVDVNGEALADVKKFYFGATAPANYVVP